MDITVTQSTFFNNFDPTKTTTNYIALIEKIKECAQSDMIKSLSLGKDEAKKVFSNILDYTGRPHTPDIFILTDTHNMIYISKRYIISLVDNDRLSGLISFKQLKITQKTLENSFKLILLKKVKIAISSVKCDPEQEYFNHDIFPLFLSHLKDCRFISMLNGTRDLSSFDFNKKNPSYIKAIKIRNPTLSSEVESRILRDLQTCIASLNEVFIEKQMDFEYKYSNKNQLIALLEIDLNSL